MLEAILQLWYMVGIFVAFFIAAAIAIYIFFDIRTLPRAGNTKLTQALYLIGPLFTLPGIVQRFIADFVDIISSSAASLPTLLMGLGILGVLCSGAALARYRLRDKPLSFQPPPYSAEVYDTATPATPIDLSTPPSLRQPSFGQISSQQPQFGPSGSIPTILDEPTAPPKPSGWLDVTVVQGQPKQDTHQLEQWQTAVLGRDPQQVTIMLNDNTVSRRHAEIRFENGQFVLYDLNSTSGTYINNVKIQRQALNNNDRIHLGRAELRYRAGF